MVKMLLLEMPIPSIRHRGKLPFQGKATFDKLMNGHRQVMLQKTLSHMMETSQSVLVLQN